MNVANISSVNSINPIPTHIFTLPPKMMLFVKSEFPDDYLVFIPKGVDEKSGQYCAKMLAFRFKFSDYKYDIHDINEAFEYFSSCDNWSDEYTNCLDKIMMEEYKSNQLTHMKCNLRLFDATRRCMHIERPIFHSLKYSDNLVKQVESFIAEHPEHLETLYREPNLWRWYSKRTLPDFFDSHQVVNFIKETRKERSIPEEDSLLLDWFRKYVWNPDDFIVK